MIRFFWVFYCARNHPKIKIRQTIMCVLENLNLAFSLGKSKVFSIYFVEFSQCTEKKCALLEPLLIQRVVVSRLYSTFPIFSILTAVLVSFFAVGGGGFLHPKILSIFPIFLKIGVTST